MRFLFALLTLSLCCQAQAQEVLRVLNWKNYIDPQVLQTFERETNIRVEYQTFTAAEELDAALASGKAYDLVVPSHFQLSRLIRNGQLLPLDMARLPNRDNVAPGLLAMLAGVDSANHYAVPYLWGVVGLAVDPLRAEASYGAPLPNSWSLLFNESQAARLQGCGLSMLDASEETASLWFNFRGRNLPQYGPRQIERSLQPLLKIVPHLSALDNEAYIEALGDRRLCVSMAWAGHALTAAQRNPDLRFQVPEEGAVAFIDSLAIPANAERADLAYRFMDYLLQPEQAIRNARTTFFYSPLKPELPVHQELARERPLQVLGAEERRRVYMLQNLTIEQKQALDRFWSTVKKGSP
ncbi:extracellular solute-binding protein [Pseudomonas sp. KB-10]|uniref:extracellular solute-binding protein n=1 Tax=Pseudomonas sp. KB-10 TaxID=2292264 RepID=UPI001BAFFFD7|nr:extracellular solute-binding protein [Pseudomonas sp. KB-10]